MEKKRKLTAADYEARAELVRNAEVTRQLALKRRAERLEREREAQKRNA